MRTEIAMKYNRRFYPIYKGLAWDPLFYSSIIFLFLTQVKQIEVSQILYADSMLAFFILLFQIPANIIIEKIGNKKALILGCSLVTIQIGMMIFVKNFISLVIAYFISALGSSLKDISQYSLLYESTNQCIGKNSFEKIDSIGSSLSYFFNATSVVLAGFLFIVNPYLPLILSTIISFLTIIICSRFEETEVSKKEKTTIKETIKDLRDGVKFIANSKRLRALFLFLSVFIGVLMMISTYENSLLKDMNVKSQYFGLIFASLTIVQCIAVQFQEKIQNKFKNRTLTFLSIPIFISFIIVGIVCSLNINNFIKFLVIVLAFILQHFFRAPFWVLENKYVTNFTNSDIRTKILATNKLINGIGRIVFSFIGGLILEYYSTSKAYIILGIGGLLLISIILKYMKTRIGLSPEEYDKKDIEYVKSVNN